jgi:hypothetical protein
VAEAVVLGALVRVGQDGVGLRGLLELLLGLGIVGIAVGVVLEREAPVGLLQVLAARAAGDAEHLVVVALRHAAAAGRTGRARLPRG